MRYSNQFVSDLLLNGCPCGWYTDPKKECHCTAPKIQKYLAKISGPLLDRIDIHLEVPSLKYKEMLTHTHNETSTEIKQRTIQARECQHKRFKNAHIFSNAYMSHREIKEFCQITNESKELLKMAIDELGLSARAHDKILKVARTIADLTEEDNILPEHIAEAIQYRSLDRLLWV